MKANKWVALLATGSMLAAAAPVSAQFGGLGALKKKLDTVAKELEKPKPAPQPQPTARPTPPQAPAPIAAPVRTQQVTAPSAPVVRQAVARKIVATEIWRCLQEPDNTPVKLEFSYLEDVNGQRQGYFTETWAKTYDDEGNLMSSEQTIVQGKGVFRSVGAKYQLRYDGDQTTRELVIAKSKDEIEYSKSRYDEFRPRFDDISLLVEKFPDGFLENINYDENPDGGLPLECQLVKPIISKYSFEDFFVQKPSEFTRYIYDNEAKKPNYSGRDAKFKDWKLLISEITENYYADHPVFGKYYSVADATKSRGTRLFLIDQRNGEIIDFFDTNELFGMTIDYFFFTGNSNLFLSVSIDDNEQCIISYSKWNGRKLELIESEILNSSKNCGGEFGAEPQILENLKLKGTD
jgi:hypothetical protein